MKKKNPGTYYAMTESLWNTYGRLGLLVTEQHSVERAKTSGGHTGIGKIAKKSTLNNPPRIARSNPTSTSRPQLDLPTPKKSQSVSTRAGQSVSTRARQGIESILHRGTPQGASQRDPTAPSTTQSSTRPVVAIPGRHRPYGLKHKALSYQPHTSKQRPPFTQATGHKLTSPQGERGTGGFVNTPREGGPARGIGLRRATRLHRATGRSRIGGPAEEPQRKAADLVGAPRATGREGGGTPFSSGARLAQPGPRGAVRAGDQSRSSMPRLAGREGRARGTHVGLGLVRRPTGRQLRKLHPSRNPKAKTLFGTANPTPLPGHEDRGGAKKTNPKLRSLKRNDEALWGTYIDLALLLERKKKQGGEDWIQKAVNPEHEGYCTPMTKSTCTPRRKAFAETMKAHKGFQK